MRHYKQAVGAVKELLGLKWSQPLAQAIMKGQPNKFVELEGDEIGIELRGEVYTPVQLAGMLLAHAGEIIALQGKKEVDVALAVPLGWDVCILRFTFSRLCVCM